MYESATWRSNSGQRYEFGVYTYYGTDWFAKPGIYIFASRENGSSNWHPYYVGQTENFKNRIPKHEQWIPARSKGATTVLACVIRDQVTRDAVERQLCQKFQPVLNQQLRLPLSHSLPNEDYGIGVFGDRKSQDGLGIGLLGTLRRN